ncbi:MAG: shikimate kinase [Endomicrobiia bacterium]|nr:shikimate kinase [Endomicrobiia bacterium]
MNIVLTGFMGTGKTATGKILASRLKREFVDTDRLVERRSGKTILEIFASAGEKAFRDLENEVVSEVSLLENKVISTGGGVVLRRENIAILRKNAIIINLAASPEKIFERLKNTDDRPLLKKPDVIGEIKKLLAEREPFYADCDFRLDTGDLNEVAAAERIMEYMASRG